MADIRFSQLEQDFDTESGTAKSLRAFQGFGRSTLLAGDLDKVGKEYQKRVKALGDLIAAEKEFDAVMADQEATEEMVMAAAEKLSAAEAETKRLEELAQKRRVELSQSLSDTGRKEQAKVSNKLRMFSRPARPFGKTLKKFKISPPSTRKQPKLMIKPSQLAKSMLTKKNFTLQRPISAITQASRSKSFGAKRTLSNKPA